MAKSKQGVCYSIISLFFALFATNEVFAQMGVKPQVTTDKALSALEMSHAFKRFVKPSVTRGQFKQIKLIKDIDVRIETSGEFEITKPNANEAFITWKVKKPDPMFICIDTNHIKMLNPRTHKKTVLKLSELAASEGVGLTKIIKLLSLNPEELATEFSVRRRKKDFLIEPLNAALDSQTNLFSSALVSLDAKKNISKLKMTEQNQDVMEIEFLRVSEAQLLKIDGSTLDKDCH